MSNGNDSKQPFQGALSLKDLSFNVLDAVHRQTPMSVVEMESNHESCLSQQQSHLQQQQLSNYARPYDIFPVVSMASVIDSSTLRRVTAAGGGSACILPPSSSTATMDLGSVSERGAGGSIRGTGVYNFWFRKGFCWFCHRNNRNRNKVRKTKSDSSNKRKFLPLDLLSSRVSSYIEIKRKICDLLMRHDVIPWGRKQIILGVTYFFTTRF